MSDVILQESEAQLRSDPAGAAERIRQLLKDDPLNAHAYRLLAKADHAVAATTGSTGEVRSSIVSGADMRLQQAARALQQDNLETAEIILRQRLLEKPSDVNALRLLADFSARLGMDVEGQQLLRYVVELAPTFTAAGLDLARHLQRQNHNDEALAIIGEVLDREPENEGALYLMAVIFGHAGRFEETVEIYRKLIARSPGRARLWASYGRSLKTIGNTKEGIAAFRTAVGIDPSLGEAWWSLADLKTVRLDEGDIARMQVALGQQDLNDNDRYYLHFALGKAFEDQRDFESSFRHYAEGNRLRREQLEHDPDRITAYVTAAARTFTPAFFKAREGWGSPAQDPIFILGMTRAGSTLIEQILASHRDIEGTMELPHVLSIARGLADAFEDRVSAFAALERGRAADLGQRYIADTRVYRKTPRPFFIDKMPNNWLYIPLIHMMLPNARIIDARRHPLACCLSNFKQNYARGQSFSYDFADLGGFYSNYVRMLAHVDAVLPGKVHRVLHEDLVDNIEAEIRRLLEYLKLPFDPACLRFHENERAVRTASAEQVRQPINRQGVDQWRAFEQWLGPLKDALGPVLDRYPEVPDFLLE